MSAILELAGQKSKGYKCRIRQDSGTWTEHDSIPENFKLSKNSCLRINAKREITYSRPGLFLGDWSPGSRPFKAPVSHGRRTDSETVFETLKASIEKKDNVNRIVGKQCGAGMYIAATDGYRALLKRGEGNGETNQVFDKLWDQWNLVSQISDPEFHLAIKRAALMAPECGMVQLFGNRDAITVYSSYQDDQGKLAGDYVGKVPAINGEFWQIALNVKYLEPLCGTWPLYVNFADKHKAILFHPQSADWAYVIMPLKVR